MQGRDIEGRCCEYGFFLAGYSEGLWLTFRLLAGTIPNDGNYPRIVRVEFSPLPSQQSQRTTRLNDNDAFLHAVISELGGREYSVIFTTTPPEDSTPIVPEPYEMEESYNSLHTDLKRDVDSHASRNGTNLPLFDSYQFLSPGKTLSHLRSAKY
jgi:hypothetical protein